MNAPLQLRSAREAKEKAKRDRWPQVCAFHYYYPQSWSDSVVDHYPRSFLRPNSTREDISFQPKHPIRLCICTIIITRRHGIHEIHALFVSINCLHLCALTRFIDQSPPKRDLDMLNPAIRDLTLSELHLSPSSVVLIRFEEPSLNGKY
jgi:tether containing UBX domain for GLUT4